MAFHTCRFQGAVLVGFVGVFFTAAAGAAQITSVTKVEDLTNVVVGSRPQSDLPLLLPIGTNTQASAPAFSISRQLFLNTFGFDPALGQLNAVTIDVTLTLNNHLLFSDFLGFVTGVNYATYSSTYSADLFIQGRPVGSMARITQTKDCYQGPVRCNEESPLVLMSRYDDILAEVFGLNTGGIIPDFVATSDFGSRSFGHPRITFTDSATLAAFSDPATLLSIVIGFDDLTLLGVKDCDRASTLEQPFCIANLGTVNGQAVLLDGGQIAVTYDYDVFAVPEPSTLWLLACGLPLLLRAKRRTLLRRFPRGE